MVTTELRERQRSELFPYRAGNLCLNFANTLDWHTSDQPIELLVTYDDLIRWGEFAEIIHDSEAARLRERAGANPPGARDALERAVNVREVIYRIFEHIAAEEPPAPADLDLFNSALGEALAHQQLEQLGDSFHWAWDESLVSLDRVVWPVIRAAAELLTSPLAVRVRQCEDDRGCGALFVDTTRNRSRRWCSMEGCGNRAKVQRHRRTK